MTAELTTVGIDHAVLHRGDEVLRLDDLAPGRSYAHDDVEFRTLPHPGGGHLASFATVNDVHFGETRCGVVEGAEDTIGPILSVPEGTTPYPTFMNADAIDEIDAADPTVVLAKGDLTTTGTDEEYQEFLDAYGNRFGDRLVHVRGNHDAYRGQDYASWPTQAVHLDGVTLALLDTTIPFASTGTLHPDQLDWLDALAADADGPVLAFGHHHCWDPGSRERPDHYFGLHPDASDALVAVMARRTNLRGWFAGHTHRNRVRRFAPTGDAVFVEVASVKDYPGSWARYDVYEGGIVQLHQRVSTPRALAWSERCREMFFGAYADYAFGTLADRCFVLPARP